MKNNLFFLLKLLKEVPLKDKISTLKLLNITYIPFLLVGIKKNTNQEWEQSGVDLIQT